MPDRIVRVGILSSECLTPLSWGAEVFFRRLMSVADDYGRYDGRPPILRAQLYPLKLDHVSEADIEGWVLECEKSEVLMTYVVAGKPYLEIQKFGQRLRAMRSKWPQPVQALPTSEGGVPHSPTSADMCQPMRPESETELETGSETKTEINTRPSLSFAQAREGVATKDNSGEDKQPESPKTPEIPTLEQIKAFAAVATVAISEEVAVAYFDKSEACGWIDHLSRPIRNWEADLKSYNRNLNATEARRQPASKRSSAHRTVPTGPQEPNKRTKRTF